MERTRNVHFLTLDLDLGGSNPIIKFGSSTHNGDHMYQVIAFVSI
jgi:hypothetical protein